MEGRHLSHQRQELHWMTGMVLRKDWILCHIWSFSMLPPHRCVEKDGTGPSSVARWLMWLCWRQYFILVSFAGYTQNTAVPDANATRPSKFSLKMVSALENAVLGTFLDESTITASLDRDPKTGILTSDTIAQDETEAHAAESLHTSSRKPLMETLDCTPFQYMARRRAALDVWKAWNKISLDFKKENCVRTK